MSKTLHLVDVSPIFYWNLPRMKEQFSLQALKMVIYKIMKYSDESDIMIFSDSIPTRKYALVDSASTIYKANRSSLSEEQRAFRGCFEYGVEEICRMLNIAHQKIEGYESDDLIYAAQREFRHEYSKVIIHSADSDMLFMVDNKVSVDRESHGFVTIDNYCSSVNTQYLVDYNTITAYNICTKNKDNRGTLGKRTLNSVLDYMKQFPAEHFCKVEDTLKILSRFLNGWQFDVLLLAMPTMLASEDYSKLIEPTELNYDLLNSMYNEAKTSNYNNTLKELVDKIENYMGGNISV